MAAFVLSASSPRAEGPGIRLGERLVFHPSIYVGTGYDSNVFYSSGVRNDPELGAFYANVRPAFSLATRPPTRTGNAPHAIDFRLTAGLPLRFIASDQASLYRHYSIGADAGMLLTLFPRGHFSVDIFDNFTRVSQTPFSYLRAAFVGEDGQNINYDNNQAGVRFRIKPGSDRFTIGLGYVFGFLFFEDTKNFSQKQLMTHRVELRVNWKFFPKTSIYLAADETIHDYYNTNPNYFNRAVNLSPGLGAPPPNAYPFRVQVGLQGLITAKLSLHLAAGYGNSFTETNPINPKGDSYSNVVAIADLNWRPLPLTALTLSYRHDFGQGLIGTYYNLDSARLALTQGIWRFTFMIRGGWERRVFSGDLLKEGYKRGREDNLFLVHGQIDFRIKDYLFLSLGDDFYDNLSNCEHVKPDPASPDPANPSYIPDGTPPCTFLRNDVWLRLNVAY